MLLSARQGSKLLSRSQSGGERERCSSLANVWTPKSIVLSTYCLVFKTKIFKLSSNAKKKKKKMVFS